MEFPCGRRRFCLLFSAGTVPSSNPDSFDREKQRLRPGNIDTSLEDLKTYFQDDLYMALDSKKSLPEIIICKVAGKFSGHFCYAPVI